jgi:tripartite-type tricarboxylate transporter receptor subunit TctC
MDRRSLGVAAAAAGLSAWAGGRARAQAYPGRPVRIVVPFPAGGGTDIHARIVARHLADMFGQSFVIDNRAGATGQIGYDHVAKSQPDGHTLVMGTGGLTILPSLYPRLAFDPMRDFQPISLAVRIQNVMIVHPSVQANTLSEFIALARANPGGIDYASTGIGNPPHLSAELLKTMARIEMNHIPFTGDTPALTNLIGGHVRMFISPMAGAMPHIREGRVRPLAVTSRTRSVALPDVPTMEEAGLPGYDITSWFGLLAPAGTPRPIVDALNAALVRIVAMPEVRAEFVAAGSDPTSTTVEEFERLMRDNLESFARIIQASGARQD